MRWSQSLRLVAVLEPPTGIAGFDDVAVMRQPVEHGCGHLRVAEDSVMAQYLTGESLRSGWSTRTTRCMAAASRLSIARQAAGLG
jgi:hypothetical protein